MTRRSAFMSVAALFGVGATSSVAVAERQPTTAVINGNFIGNPDELAKMIADAIERGGEPYNKWRVIANQLVDR